MTNYIFELTPGNEVRRWAHALFSKVPDYEEKLLFGVPELTLTGCNPIDDIKFPQATFFVYEKEPGEPDVFDLEKGILVYDRTNEIKPITLKNIWKLIDAGSWQEYEHRKKEAKNDH